LSQNKESKLQIRITEELETQINELVELFREKTGVKTTKTSIVESALEKGLIIIKSRLDK
jgi:hypothetical protein